MLVRERANGPPPVASARLFQSQVIAFATALKPFVGDRSRPPMPLSRVGSHQVEGVEGGKPVQSVERE